MATDPKTLRSITNEKWAKEWAAIEALYNGKVPLAAQILMSNPLANITATEKEISIEDIPNLIEPKITSESEALFEFSRVVDARIRYNEILLRYFENPAIELIDKVLFLTRMINDVSSISKLMDYKNLLPDFTIAVKSEINFYKKLKSFVKKNLSHPFLIDQVYSFLSNSYEILQEDFGVTAALQREASANTSNQKKGKKEKQKQKVSSACDIANFSIKEYLSRNTTYEMVHYRYLLEVLGPFRSENYQDMLIYFKQADQKVDRKILMDPMVVLRTVALEYSTLESKLKSTKNKLPTKKSLKSSSLPENASTQADLINQESMAFLQKTMDIKSAMERIKQVDTHVDTIVSLELQLLLSETLDHFLNYKSAVTLFQQIVERSISNAQRNRDKLLQSKVTMVEPSTVGTTTITSATATVTATSLSTVTAASASDKTTTAENFPIQIDMETQRRRKKFEARLPWKEFFVPEETAAAVKTISEKDKKQLQSLYNNLNPHQQDVLDRLFRKPLPHLSNDVTYSEFVNLIRGSKDPNSQNFIGGLQGSIFRIGNTGSHFRVELPNTYQQWTITATAVSKPNSENQGNKILAYVDMPIVTGGNFEPHKGTHTDKNLPQASRDLCLEALTLAGITRERLLAAGIKLDNVQPKTQSISTATASVPSSAPVLAPTPATSRSTAKDKGLRR